MELRVLKYFLAVARHRNIPRAAEELHLTQPTISRQLQESLISVMFCQGVCPAQQNVCEQQAEYACHDLRPAHHEAEQRGKRCRQGEQIKDELRPGVEQRRLENGRHKNAASPQIEYRQLKGHIAERYDRHHRKDRQLPLPKRADRQSSSDHERPARARRPHCHRHHGIEQAADQKHLHRPRNHRQKKAQSLQDKRQREKKR